MNEKKVIRNKLVSCFMAAILLFSLEAFSVYGETRDDKQSEVKKNSSISREIKYEEKKEKISEAATPETATAETATAESAEGTPEMADKETGEDVSTGAGDEAESNNEKKEEIKDDNSDSESSTTYINEGDIVVSPITASDLDKMIGGFQSSAYIVLNTKDDTVAIEKDADERMLPASTTKIMTIALALEMTGESKNEMMKRDYVVSKDVVNIPYGSTAAWLSEGERVSLWEMLMATEIISANDGANALAEIAGDSIDNFVEKMNEKAKELGCENTHFMNPHGCSEDGHYISPRDLAVITKWALSVPFFREVFSTDSYTMDATNMCSSRPFKSKNELSEGHTYSYEGIIGGKSGWTPESRYTQVEVAKRENMELVAVIMNCNGWNQKFIDETGLLDFGFSILEMRKESGIVEKHGIIK